MIHDPETNTVSQLHFPGTGFWYVCHANLGVDSSGSRVRRQLECCSISKPETGMHMTELTYDWSTIIVYIFMGCKVVFIWAFVILSAMFIFGFIWYQIPAPIKTLFYLRSETSMHVTEMTFHWSIIIVYVFMLQGFIKGCYVFIYLFTWAFISNSFQPHLVLAAEIFIPEHMVWKTGTENRRQKMELIYAAGFWSVCHGVLQCNRHINFTLITAKPLLANLDKPKEWQLNSIPMSRDHSFLQKNFLHSVGQFAKFRGSLR